ncbi:hypothetical protein C1H46_039106 [Malus baccata]|uniref:Uncharacterized protein n=1 Tax=Malus baccata TaxID=106549 RepID=A0A540KM95_MALBA|nr:hypothetical protein C1H46_039106 [Malus baccata]
MSINILSFWVLYHKAAQQLSNKTDFKGWVESELSTWACPLNPFYGTVGFSNNGKETSTKEM